MTKKEHLKKMIEAYLALEKAGLKEKQIMELMKLNRKQNNGT